VRNPDIIAQGARAFGSQCIVLSMQVRRTASPSAAFPSGCEVVIDGGRTPTGRDALLWSQEGERLGAGELCINSIDRDGTKLGYDLEVTRLVSESVPIPVIASGGAGEPRHLLEVFTGGAADAAIVASIVHYGEHPIPDLKRYLRASGVEVREAIALTIGG
jgi:cyclase